MEEQELFDVDEYTHPVTGHLLEVWSKNNEVTSVRLFDGTDWHVAPIHKWSNDDWKNDLNEWHNHIVQSAASH